MAEKKPTAAERKKLNAHLWERDPQDWYVEPEAVSKRLFEVEQFHGDIVDPSCGLGRIPLAAAEAGLNAVGTDIVARWDKYPPRKVAVGLQPSLIQADFLSDNWGCGDSAIRWWREPANIISNPPFKECLYRHKGGEIIDYRYIRLCLERARSKVALILPATFDCGGRNSRFLQSTPYYKKLIITPRPSMPPGTVIVAGEPAGGGEVDFAIYIWLKGYVGAPTNGWLDWKPERQPKRLAA